MEMYKVETVNPITLQSEGVKDSQIPSILVQTIREALQKFGSEGDDSGFIVTPLMVTTNLKEISFGIIEKRPDEALELKYVVSISTKQHKDEFYNKVFSEKADEKSDRDD